MTSTNEPKIPENDSSATEAQSSQAEREQDVNASIEAGESTESSTSDSWPIGEHYEEVVENGTKVRRRGIFLLPNALTTAALFCGFYAVVSAMNGLYETAAMSIFFAMIFDGLDGRVARMTGTSSEFGVQYDSLSDMCSFGVAPALVSFAWASNGLGKLGWAATFIYVACAAIRLARFNTMVDTADKNYFTGLASPAAAGVVASMVWLGSATEVTPLIESISAFVTCLAGLLMVTNLKYNSFKGLDLKGRVPFAKMVGLIVIFGLILLNPPVMFLVIFGGYAISGILMHYRRR